ncbi:MAG: Gfo/Idh/MocA family oxidoreductase [Thermoguttaceae bacterium]
MSTTALHRRQFLGRSLAAGTACLAPCVLPAASLGLEGATPPSDRIGMGFVGLGGQGGGHLFGGSWTYLPGGYLARDDVQVLGVCDVQRKRAEEGKARVEQHYAKRFAAGSYQGCGAYNDIRDMLLRPDIDAVLIAASYHAQGVLATHAVRAGKDVYCEKPTSITIQWGRALADAVRAHARVYQAGTQQRSEYGGKFRRAVELVRGGAIGRLERVYAYQVGGGFQPPPPGPERPIPADVNWEAYVGPLPWFPYDGNTGAHRFGWGDINWGQHHYDIVQWGMAADRTGPVEIRLQGNIPVYRYAGGVEVFGCPPPGTTWDEGGACFVGTQGRITVHRNKFFSDPPELVKQAPGPAGRVYHSDSHSGNFLECVRTRQQTISDAETAHRANSVLLLGGIAMRLGRTLRWDPEHERFLDDPAADRMLSLAAREPWRV